MPDLITRKAAKLAGLKSYFTGKPCCNGHVDEREVSNGRCRECGRAAARAWKLENAARVAGYDKEWRAANPDKIRVIEDGRLKRKRAKTVIKRERESVERAARIAATTEWRCINCEAVLPLKDFYADASKALGISSRCKICTQEATSVWFQENKPRALASRAQYYELNKDALTVAARAWRAENPGSGTTYSRNRRARVAAVGGSHTPADIERIRAAQKDRCAACRTKLIKAGHVDHIKPISKGGSNAPKNLQLLCARCNLRKNAKDPIEFMQSLGRLL